MSMPVHVAWQVLHCSRAPTVTSARNGPPDIETIARRRVDPPAGCRATTEPATLAARRSAERYQLKNNRRTTEYRTVRRTGRSRVGTSSGLAVFGTPGPRHRVGRRASLGLMQPVCIAGDPLSGRQTEMHHDATTRYMTDFGMYGRHTDRMWNIELGRIIQEDREREIAAGMRLRQLTRPAESDQKSDAPIARPRGAQRPASTGAASR
jgi:hypothetical protein